MQYTIIINQYGIAEQGLINKTDIVDWAIIDFLYKMFFSQSDRRIIQNNKEYVLITYEFIMKCLPLLKITNKSSISRRFNKFKKLGIIEIVKNKDNSQYFRITPYTQSIYINQIEVQKKYAK